MNPARTFGSAFHVGYWLALWIYFIAPTSGMLVASEVFLRVRGGVDPYCAKLHHANNKRCIFHNGHSIVRPYPAVESVNSHDASFADVGNLEQTRTSRCRNETKDKRDSVF